MRALYVDRTIRILVQIMAWLVNLVLASIQLFWLLRRCIVFWHLKSDLLKPFASSNFLGVANYVWHIQVVVSTKSPRSEKQYVWEGAAESSSYVIKEETDPEKMLLRGTQITLYLRVIYLQQNVSFSFVCVSQSFIYIHHFWKLV